MAAVTALRSTSPSSILSATCTAGLSLGEYSSLCFAGALSFEDGVRLTAARGAAMQSASDASPSGMVSVIGLDSTDVSRLCAAASSASGESVSIANYLGAGNYAVSGSRRACDLILDIAKRDFGARMAVPLAVAGAFHTHFMAPALGRLEEALKLTDIRTPRIPVISNVDACTHSDPAVIKALLLKQLTNPVQWELTMEKVVSGGCEKAFELGPGKVLSGLIKKRAKEIITTHIDVK